MSFGIEGLHMCITEHYLLQAKLLKVFQNFKLLEVVKEKVKNAKVVMATLNGLQGSWDSFIQGMCARRRSLPLANYGKSAHKKNLDS